MYIRGKNKQTYFDWNLLKCLEEKGAHIKFDYILNY